MPASIAEAIAAREAAAGPDPVAVPVVDGNTAP
jgi:hypothetical protein